MSGALRLRRAPDQSVAGAGFRARLGWTRIGSPGIFGERNTKALFRAAKGQVAGERKWAGYRVSSHPLVSA